MSNIITEVSLVQHVQRIWRRNWKGMSYDGVPGTEEDLCTEDAFPHTPGMLLLGGIRGYEHGRGWTANKRDRFNDALFYIQMVSTQEPLRVGMARGTTDPGHFKKVFNKEGDLHLMVSRIGGPYWARVGKHRGKPAFNLFGRGVISRTRKGWETGDPYDVEFRTVKNLRRLGLNIHPMKTNSRHSTREPKVGMKSAGCQGAAKTFIDEMLAAAAEAKRLCRQTVFAFCLLDERDFA